MRKGKFHTKDIGPGGIKCNCCKPMKTAKDAKRHVTRLIRIEARKEEKNI